MIRSTVRVRIRRRLSKWASRAYEPEPYEKDPAKWVMMPAFAKPRRKVQLERIEH